jgi:hypothetical protein
MTTSPTTRSGFSPSFDSTILEGASYSSQREKDLYQSLKEDIQYHFKPNAEGVGKFSATLLSSELGGLNTHNIERLAVNTENRGFDVSVRTLQKKGRISTLFSKLLPTLTKDTELKQKKHTQIIISLPKNKRYESGRTSPGWDERFCASLLKRVDNRIETKIPSA